MDTERTRLWWDGPRHDAESGRCAGRDSRGGDLAGRRLLILMMTGTLVDEECSAGRNSVLPDRRRPSQHAAQ